MTAFIAGVVVGAVVGAAISLVTMYLLQGGGDD